MNRHLLSSSALHDFSDNSFTRRASLAGGLNIGNGKKRPKIDIVLEDQPPGFHVPSYTTRDRIYGHVTITSPSDAAFDDIHISLQGTSRTWVEKIATTAPTNPRTRAFHTFLRLLQPIEESDVPEQHVLRAGRPYRIPFEFVIPQRLLPQSCSHSRRNPGIEDEHLKLPPSLGDAMISGDGRSLQSDFAPEMTTISYSIRTVVTRKPRGTQSKQSILGDNQLKLRIVPQVDELPPLDVTNDPGEDYVLKKVKSIKKGILMGKAKIGTLTVETSQPPSLRLPNVRHAANAEPSSATTMVTLKVRFDPVRDGIKPPKLQMLWSRLKIATFFSTVPQKTLPTKSAAFSMDQNKGLMVDTLPLSSRCLGGQTWAIRNSDRRDSAVAFSAEQTFPPEVELPESPLKEPQKRTQSPSPASISVFEDGCGDTYYTADVLVPVELPYQKFAFVPTFHSCLVSRVYALDMSLAVGTGAGSSQSIHLKVPVQITSAGSENPAPLEGMTPEGGFIGARGELHDVFAPNMAIGDDAPPDFEDLPPLGGRRATYDLGSINSTNVSHAATADMTDGRQHNDWADLVTIRTRNPAEAVLELDGARRADEGLLSSGTAIFGEASPTSRSITTRSPSPRTDRDRITNDEILNTENYETPVSPSSGFVNFSWATSGSPTLPNDDIPGRPQTRRAASEALPPGYSSVAAGTMLMGTGGMVRALS